jgi:endoglucanase
MVKILLLILGFIFLPALFAIGNIALPLSTSGRFIVDSNGLRVKLACVNWYGAEEKDFVVGGLQFQTISYISASIASYGFNCVRLPFSLQLFVDNPTPPNDTLVANPNLFNLPALTIFDYVISNLTGNKIMVILDNHNSDADWCCSITDGNGLWYTANYSESSWISTWQTVVQRYKNNSYVIGCDLRNEPRQSTINNITFVPTWGDGNNATDWRAAAQRAGNAILQTNPKLLIFVEGTNGAGDLTKAAQYQVILNISNKVVYSAHAYQNGVNFTTYTMLQQTADYLFGTVIQASLPLWVGEIGTCNNNPSCYINFWGYAIQYLAINDIDFSYWAWDGTQSTGTTRTFNATEIFGLMNSTWNGVASTRLMSDLQSIQKPNATQSSHNATQSSHNATHSSHNATQSSHNATHSSHNATHSSHNATQSSHKSVANHMAIPALVWIFITIYCLAILLHI